MKLFLTTFILTLTLLTALGVNAQQSLEQPFPNTDNRIENISNTDNRIENISNTGGGGGQNMNSSNSGGACQNIQNFAGLVGCFTSLINLVIPLVIGIAVFLFLWGLIKYITAGGDYKSTAEARKFMLFGIIALFVMVSVWGLVGILVNTFFAGGVAIPQLK